MPKDWFIESAPLPHHVNDTLTLEDSRISPTIVCVRVSGASGDSLSTSDTNLPQANCNKMIESSLW
ncbi:MAG TPA: hypothetical protein IAA33_02285 [Candidatus Helicobacter avicola]|nr:hypothetical protein [Candidatus Helicobacter avicola]